MAGLQKAEEQDTWIHHITAGGKTRSTSPRVKAKYIEERIDTNTPVEGKPWMGEISGRALSLCRDIISFAQQKAAEQGLPPNFKFRGFAYAGVLALKNGGFPVYLDQSDNDQAHALLTIPELKYAPTAEGVDEKRISQDLIEKIRGLLEFAEFKEGENNPEVSKLEASSGSVLSRAAELPQEGVEPNSLASQPR